jgi:hypothetical protein
MSARRRLPDGVVNFVTGPGSTLGQALVDNPEVDGVTFTGSFDVGMKMYRDFANRNYVRPIILELGGKNPPSSRATRTSKTRDRHRPLGVRLAGTEMLRGLTRDRGGTGLR